MSELSATKIDDNHKITRRHIARLLTLLESMGVDQQVITAVKSEIWDLHNDLIAATERKESKESNGEKENEIEPKI